MESHYLLSLFVCAFSAVGHPVFRFSVSSDKLVDLSHSFDRNTVYWPTIPENSTFHLKTLHELINSTDGTAYRDKFFQGSEHGGTHMDAPSHFWKNGSVKSTTSISLRSRLRARPAAAFLRPLPATLPFTGALLFTLLLAGCTAWIRPSKLTDFEACRRKKAGIFEGVENTPY